MTRPHFFVLAIALSACGSSNLDPCGLSPAPGSSLETGEGGRV